MLSGFDGSLPLDRASTLPSHCYFDQQTYEQELKHVFRRGWHYVGQAVDLQEPGSFITGWVGQEPVIVVRDPGGELRALSNICRHRGTILLTRPKGKVPSIGCRYHGWTYGLDGSLKAAPQFEGVCDFHPKDYALPSFSVCVSEPFVFVSLEEKPAPIEKWTGAWHERMPQQRLSDLHFHSRVQYKLDCNWKVFVDNYLDGGYHVATLHQRLASALEDSEYTTELFERSSLQSVPLKASGNALLDAVRQGDRAYYWWFYPNFMINVYDGVMDTNLVLPRGPEKCEVFFDYYFQKNEQGRFNEALITQSIQVAHRVQLEDQEISESVQRGLQSAFYESGRFSVKREGSGYQFHRLLARDLTGPSH